LEQTETYPEILLDGTSADRVRQNAVGHHIAVRRREQGGTRRHHDKILRRFSPDQKRTPEGG
jgi:hypothetical protein